SSRRKSSKRSRSVSSSLRRSSGSNPTISNAALTKPASSKSLRRGLERYGKGREYASNRPARERTNEEIDRWKPPRTPLLRSLPARRRHMALRDAQRRDFFIAPLREGWAKKPFMNTSAASSRRVAGLQGGLHGAQGSNRKTPLDSFYPALQARRARQDPEDA